MLRKVKKLNISFCKKIIKSI